MIDDLQEDELRLIRESLAELEFTAVLNVIEKYCYSDLGTELVSKSFPTDNIDWLRREHQSTSEMTDLLVLDSPVPFDGVTDIRQKLYKSKIENAVLTSVEILSLFDFVRACRLIKQFFKTRIEKYATLAEEASFLYENILLEKHITDAIDDSGDVRDIASIELRRIRREIHEKSARLRSRMQKVMKSFAEEDLLNEEFVTLREGRFVLPVKSEHKRHLSGIIHGVSQTGATVYIEPSDIIEMNNELSLLANEEKREIYKILQNLTGEIGLEAREFIRSAEIIAHIDSLSAKAKYALEFGGIKPEILDENYIYMKNVYHPLLVHAKKKQNVIPLSLEFSENVRGHLISGPNAGGKTVALKSIGLNIVMALSGIFPLGECKSGIRTVFTSIGDHQSIENNLSTFSSQIISLKDIIENCNSNSLVLIDEICSGTDPQEGSALAAGILETFIELNLFFVATTHQSSLKTYALNRTQISNASLEFDEKKLKPTYKFLSGIPGNSYAFVLANNLGMPGLVLNRAGNYLGSHHKELEESISILQRMRSEAEELRIRTIEEKENASKIKSQYDEKFKKFKEKKAKLLEEARTEALYIVQDANALIESTIREIKEQQRAVADIKKDFQKKKSLIEESADAIQKDTAKLKDLAEFREGDDVIMVETGSRGSILEIDDKAGTALVEFNGMKFRLPTERLKIAPKIEEKRKSGSEYIKFNIQTKLDLRGMRAEESIMELEKFLSEAILSNADFLTIIHGKGTGVLRQVVHEFLNKFPQVVSFRLGEINEGGSGVTIVSL